MQVPERGRPSNKRPDADFAPRGERPERKSWNKDGDDRKSWNKEGEGAPKRKAAAAKDKPAYKSDKPFKEKGFAKDKGKPAWAKDGDKPRAKRKAAND